MVPRLLIVLALVCAFVGTAGADSGLAPARTYESRHFSVRFEGPNDPALLWALLERLEAAGREVDRQLGLEPRDRVAVLLYTDGAFPTHASVPHWAQSLYDGQIRLAVSWEGLRDERLDQTLRHEYTHALLHARAGGAMPVWLSEGLAVMQEGRRAEPEALPARTDRLIPLEQLHGSFVNLPPADIPLAYAESVAAVEFLTARYGPRGLRALIVRLERRDDFTAAFQAATGESYADFQAAWRRTMPAPSRSN